MRKKPAPRGKEKVKFAFLSRSPHNSMRPSPYIWFSTRSKHDFIRAPDVEAHDYSTIMGESMRPIFFSLTCLAASATTAPALASSTTAQFNVTLTITKQCTVTAPSMISIGQFGANDLISTTASASQNYSVNCSKSTPYTIGFSSTNDASSGSGVHQMRGTGQNADVVQYSLFDGSSSAPVPLDASNHVVSDTGTGASQTKSLKAQVVNYTTAVTPDVYTDTVTMTITY